VPFPYLLKRLFGLVLVAAQQRDHLSPFELELRQEFSRHSLAVNHDPLDQRLACRLLVAVEHLRQAKRQVVLASMRGGQEWMPPGIV